MGLAFLQTVALPPCQTSYGSVFGMGVVICVGTSPTAYTM